MTGDLLNQVIAHLVKAFSFRADWGLRSESP